MHLFFIKQEYKTFKIPWPGDYRSMLVEFPNPWVPLNY